LTVNNYQKPLVWLENQANDMLELLCSWSNINSGSAHLAGLSKQLSALQTAFSRLGGHAAMITLPSFQQLTAQGKWQTREVGQALSIQKRPDAPLQILLCGHMDTVFGCNSPFQQCQQINPNKLLGPGVADMKAGLVILLYALIAFEQSEVAKQLGWQVLITPDEEIGSLASAKLLTQAAKNKDYAFIFEPAMDTSGTLASKRKGSGKFTLLVQGKAAHAGRDFAKGCNAIVAAADLILGIERLNQQGRELTINVGLIEGGEATNVVAEYCLCQLDVRTTSNDDETWFQAELAKLIAHIEQRPGIQVKLHGLFTRKPKPMDDKTQRLFNFVKQCGQALGLSITWKPSGGCCDGNNLAAAGLAVVDTLGARGNHIHSHQEYILIDSLVERAKLTSFCLWQLAHKGRQW